MSLQVLDGVLCHNGEMELERYQPVELTDFQQFDKRVEDCYTDPEANKQQIPSTLEGCVMRISDIIAYLGKDRQDAVKVGILKDEGQFTGGKIGTTNAEIINNMIVAMENRISVWKKTITMPFQKQRRKTISRFIKIHW